MQQTAKSSVQKWIIYSATTITNERGNASSAVERLPFFCQWTATERKQALEHLQAVVARNALHHTPDATLLTSVPRHNTIRAMMFNAAYLGLTIELLREDILSPFNVAGPLVLDPATLPPSLQPTALQKQIVHHPWIDLCPIPSLRDVLLLGADIYDEDELCHDFFEGAGSDGEQQVGMVVWGESWDPSAYEISAAIVSKWHWLLGPCADILQSTDHWRSKRNEAPVRLSLAN